MRKLVIIFLLTRSKILSKNELFICKRVRKIAHSFALTSYLLIIEKMSKKGLISVRLLTFHIQQLKIKNICPGHLYTHRYTDGVIVFTIIIKTFIMAICKACIIIPGYV